jgi:thiol-disulfide isomerase/thioredoxin
MKELSGGENDPKIEECKQIRHSGREKDTLRKSLVWTGGNGLVFWILLVMAGVTAASAQPDPAVETRIVDYLKEQIKVGKPVIVTELFSEVFTSEEERKVLDRLFNAFFNIPIFIVQYKSATDRIPTLDDIASQFNLQIPGEVEVLLRIMENDPRIPDFIERDPESGEIVRVDIEAVKEDKRFNQAMERTLAGWLGRSVPPFELDLSDGGKIGSAGLAGRNYLIYFWFSACPPCVRTSPHLVRLYERFKDRNFTIIAVNADRLLELGTTDEERAAYVEKQGIHFPVAYLNKQMQEDYGNVNVYPTFFLVDSRGIIHKHYVGYQPPNVLTEAVEELLERR